MILTCLAFEQENASDDPDLEDGEIASDEEGGAAEEQTSEKESPVKREKVDDGPPARERPRDRDQGDRRRRSRFSQPSDDEPDRKRRKNEGAEETQNEDELLGLCVRGGSPAEDSEGAPLWKAKPAGQTEVDWAEDADDDRKRRRGFRGRDGRDARDETHTRVQIKRKMKAGRKGVADKEVCLNYLKGACTKGAECFYSHNVCQPRKMELCKFYLKDCCMKRDKCLYLHEEFPCKYFHTGLKCYANKTCKFSHEPLNNFTREVLLKHMETAPKEILGDFPRMNRESAEAAVDRPNSEERMSQERAGEEVQRDDSPNNRKRSEGQRGDRQISDGPGRFNRGDRQSPDAGYRFRRGDRPSPDGSGRFSGRGEKQRRGDRDDRRRERGNRHDDNILDSPRKRNFGPDGPDHRDRRFGPDCNSFGSDGRNFGPDGPGSNNFGPDGRNFGSDGAGNSNFGPDSPCNNNFGPGGRNFGPESQSNNFNSDGRNFGPEGAGGNNSNNFGPGNMSNSNFGYGNPNFGPFGMNNSNFGPNMNNFRPGGGGMMNQNFGFGGPNSNFGTDNPNFMSNNFNFGPNGPNTSNFGPNGPNFGPNGPTDGERMRHGRDVDRNRGDERRGERERERRGHTRSEREAERRDEWPAEQGNERDVERRLERVDHEGELERRGDGNKRGSRRRDHHSQHSHPQRNQTGLSATEDRNDEDNSGTSSPFDFAKELAEYKNKKMELEIQRHQQEVLEEEQQAAAVIEKGPVLLQSQQPQPASTQQPQQEQDTPPPFTQLYPPFPSNTDQDTLKEKKDKHGNAKKHHHHKKKKKHEGNEEDKIKRDERRRERKEKKRQPVIVSEDGSFGGIKFKIKLNPSKEDRKAAPAQRRPSEFMSSDDEIPLNYLQNQHTHRKDKEDDETDTESRLVIETNDEPESAPEPAAERSVEYPAHLPRRQQELMRRIQSHQPRDLSATTNSPMHQSGDRTPTPEPADENWYSSDDEVASPKAESGKKENPTELTKSTTPPPVPSQPKIELAALKDLSKINITELLSSIRQITVNQPKSQPQPQQQQQPAAVPHRDPRSERRRSSGEEKPPYAKSIYDVMPRPSGSLDVDERAKDVPVTLPQQLPFGDVDLRLLGDAPLPALGLGLPFKPAPLHTAATEIEASLASHPPMDYKVTPIHVPPPDFSHIKISPSDPLVKKDPRLRRLFRVSSVDEPRTEEPKKTPSGLSDPRRKACQFPETPKSPPDTPFSPPQEVGSAPSTAPRLTPNLLTLVQLGLSAATGGAAFDPRLRSLVPQDIEQLRAAVASLRPEDLEVIRAIEHTPGPQGPVDGPRPAGQGLLPTPSGVGLLPTPPPFMMNNIMPMDGMMPGAMRPLGGPLGLPMGQVMGGPITPPMPPFNFGGEPQMNDSDMRMFRGGFKGDQRGGRGNWRGGRDRNWDNRRHRGRNRDKDDRRDRRSFSPE